MELTLRSFN